MAGRKEKTPSDSEPDPRSQQLILLLKEVFSDFDLQPAQNLDEVEAEVEPSRIRDVCRIAKEDTRLQFDYLRCLSVVDYNETLQTVYHLYSTRLKHRVVFKASAPRENPVFASVTPVWRGADWHEREGAELFGVTFEGHPNPQHLLLWDGFEGYPGRKEYPFAEIEIVPGDIEVPE
jgi:NADH-quinone oxidoreductase subunit C